MMRVVNATPRPLNLRERPGTHCIGGWVGPSAGMDGCGKCRPHRDSIPGLSSPYRIAIPTELPGSPRNPRTKIISWPLGMGSTGCPETSVRNYHYTLRNSSEERRFIIQICLRNILHRFEVKKKNSF